MLTDSAQPEAKNRTARKLAQETMRDVRESMGLEYH